jgi:hypothetical protein
MKVRDYLGRRRRGKGVHEVHASVGIRSQGVYQRLESKFSGIERFFVWNSIPQTGAGVILDNVCVYLSLCEFSSLVTAPGGGIRRKGRRDEEGFAVSFGRHAQDRVGEKQVEEAHSRNTPYAN